MGGVAHPQGADLPTSAEAAREDTAMLRHLLFTIWEAATVRAPVHNPIEPEPDDPGAHPQGAAGGAEEAEAIQNDPENQGNHAHPPQRTAPRRSKVKCCLIVMAVFLFFGFNWWAWIADSTYGQIMVAYLRLNLLNRGTAMDMQYWNDVFGGPLTIAQPAEPSRLVTTILMVGVAAWRQLRD